MKWTVFTAFQSQLFAENRIRYNLNMLFPWDHPSATPERQLMSKLRDTSMGELVKEDLLKLILQGDLRPGMRINEPDIAQRLGVSRVPVREALKLLESTGLIVAKKHAGMFVRVLSTHEVSELYELRAMFDAYAGHALVVKLGRKRAALESLNLKLVRSVEAMAVSQGQVYYLENLRFHWLLMQASGNAHACEMYKQIVQKLHVARIETLSSPANRELSIDEHRNILKALHASVLTQDSTELVNAMRSHVNLAHQRQKLLREHD